MDAPAATTDGMKIAAATTAAPSPASSAAPAATVTTGTAAGAVSTPASAGQEQAPSPGVPTAAGPGSFKSLLATGETKSPATPDGSTAKAAPIADAPPVEIVLKAPEGVDVPAADLTAVTEFAKANKLSQAQADAILSRDIASRKASAEAQAQEVRTIGETWSQQAKEHPEIGGDKLPGAIAAAKRALMVHANAEERAMIDASPFGSNPTFLAIMARVGARLTEDTVHAGNTGATAPKSPGEIMYPHLYAKK